MALRITHRDFFWISQYDKIQIGNHFTDSGHGSIRNYYFNALHKT